MRILRQGLDGVCDILVQLCKDGTHAEEVCKENQHQTGKGADNKELNPFKGDSVPLNLNLPGTVGYDPTFI